MPNYAMEIGRSDFYGYVGVQPPLSDEDYDLILPRVYPTKYLSPLGTPIQRTYRSRMYTEFNYSLEIKEPTSAEQANESIITVARDIARVLNDNGNDVQLDTEIRTLSYESNLFDARQLET